jgi:DNA-binding response OmpR family regulator
VIRWRVLLVDDDHQVQIMLKAFLETRGYLVDLAVNGQDALAKLGEADYDIVVTDYNMPDVDGVGILRHTRQSRPLLPVVLMTGGDSSAITAREIVELGAQACLLKPFDLQTLDKTLTAALSLSSNL